MPQNQPLVSIGIPVYNGERYLEQTIDSILAQTYSNFELIISDNGSIDRTQEICEKYVSKDKRIKYHRNEKNLGAAPNYNLVFELSSGKYFKWADYDDLLAPEFISKCVDVLNNYPDAAVCFPKAKLIDENGRIVDDYEPLPDTSSPQPHVRFRNLILAPDHHAIQASGLMRSDLVGRSVLHGSYSSSDEVFLASYALLGNFLEIPEQLIYVRIHPKQSTQGNLASERVRVSFYDTSVKEKVVLVKWLYFKSCLSAIHISNVSAYQRIMCYVHLLRWLMIPQNFRSIVKDMLLALHERVPLFPKLYQETLAFAKKTDYNNG